MALQLPCVAVIAVTEAIEIAILSSTALVVAALIGLFASGRSSRRRLEEAIDTGNGSKLGVTVHRMEGILEVVSGQIHTNTKEVLEVAAKLNAHIEEVRAQSDDYYENVKPVVDKLRKEQGGESG